jgi:hypothetical protein
MSKTAFIPGVPAKSESDFEVSAASRLAGYRRFFGVLSVVRTTDGRRLFPFAAQVCGEHIVAADLANPEL